jgi:F-type H+-transporting ATPase subunit a
MFLFAEGGEHLPLIVEFINHYLGEPVHNIQMATTYKMWTALFAKFGAKPEDLFGPYTAENAIPWYTIMFVIACILTFILIAIFKGKLSEDDPTHGQLTLEAGFLAIKDLVVNVIGENGFQYFPVVATFAVLILVSNLMGMVPLFMSPTAHVNVTYALGLTSFVYFNYIGIKENGLWGYISHFSGPKLPVLMAVLITPLIFVIEIISTMIRPFTLGVRLFANMFADEQLASQIASLFPPYSQILIPVVLMPLGVFVAFVQTLVFTLLSMIYISLVVSHDHRHEEHETAHGETAVAHA